MLVRATVRESLMSNVTRPLNYAQIAEELALKVDQVANVVALLDEGNTVPFITRYRKERTGNLDEEKIRQIEARANALRQLVGSGTKLRE